MTHVLAKLPYEYDALKPYVSPETLSLHYGKHHQGYINKLNTLIPGTMFEKLTLEQLVKAAPNGPIFNNAAQAWNHEFYWKSLSPNGGGIPHGRLGAAIKKTFSNFEEFKNRFTEAALTTFGSGWVWLVLNADGDLKIAPSQNAGNPLTWGDIPLLVIDVWEHAYYLDHKNSRADYLTAFWKIVNWDFVAENYALASTKRPDKLMAAGAALPTPANL